MEYSELRHLNLEKLSEAVSAWAALPGKIRRSGQTFKTQVAKGLLDNSDWEGEAADAASKALRGIGFQIDNSETEASNVHKLLKSGYTAFRSAKQELRSIEAELQGHRHLSVRSEDGSVYVDPNKVDSGELKSLQDSYEHVLKAYKERTQQALEDAGKADSTLRWALKEMAKSYDSGFLPAAPSSLSDARHTRRSQSRESNKAISLKDISDQEVASKTNSAPVAIQFISAKPLIAGFEQAGRGDILKGADTATGFLPSYIAGKASGQVEQRIKGPGEVGKHRKMTPLNKVSPFVNMVGRTGVVAFGWPVSAVATVVDFAYTPEFDSEEKREQSRVVAPEAPRLQKWN